jgi:hypothetical protein
MPRQKMVTPMEAFLTALRAGTSRKAMTALGLAFLLALAAFVLLQPGCRTGALAVNLDQKIKAKEKAAPDDIKEHAATGFPLEGRHAELACDSCHGGKKEPKPVCSSCHTPPHGPKFNRKCETCHTAGHPFTEVKFKHRAKGGFSFHQGIAALNATPTGSS